MSENAGFAAKVEAAGIAFIGPRPETIDALGERPGPYAGHEGQGARRSRYPGPVESYEDGRAFIQEYGFPVIIKAAMGGGGRGMGSFRDEASFKESFERAVSEAKSAFGDGTVFIERASRAVGILRERLTSRLLEQAATHRGPAPGRCRGQLRPPVRARLLRSATTTRRREFAYMQWVTQADR